MVVLLLACLTANTSARDCRSLNRIQVAKVNSEGVLVSEPFNIETSWDIGSYAIPKPGHDTDGSW